MSSQEYLEVVDTILKLAIEADSGNTRTIVQLSRWTRKQYYQPLRLQILADNWVFPVDSNQVVVRHKRLRAFIRDVVAFGEVFKGEFTFGEINRVRIAVPPWDKQSLAPLLDVLSMLPIEYLKVEADFDHMEIKDLWTFVGRVGAKVGGVRVLAIRFNYYPGYSDDELAEYLASFRKWHSQHVFKRLSLFTSLTTLKVRTPLPMFPADNHSSDTPDTRRPSLEKWSSTIFDILPSLTMLLVSENYSEEYGVDHGLYQGERLLWSKKNGIISHGGWDWPTKVKTDRWGKTTRKVDFDPWQTDGEFGDEYGWSDAEE